MRKNKNDINIGVLEKSGEIYEKIKKINDNSYFVDIIGDI